LFAQIGVHDVANSTVIRKCLQSAQKFRVESERDILVDLAGNTLNQLALQWEPGKINPSFCHWADWLPV